MSVHKIIKPDSPFEIFPRSTLQDQNLDCFELGALARLCSLPAGWDFSARGLERLLGIGKDKRQGLLARLAQHGYYRVSKRHARDVDFQGATSLEIRPGQWLYEHEFSALGDLKNENGNENEPRPNAAPARAGNSGAGENEKNKNENWCSKEGSNEPEFPCALSAGAGDASAGKQGPIDITLGEKEDCDRENTPPPPALTDGREVVVDLIFPNLLSSAIKEIGELVARREDAQAILDELGAGLARPDEKHRIRDPLRWVSNVISGRLRRTPAGLAIEKVRRSQSNSAGSAPTTTSLKQTDAYLGAFRKFKKIDPPSGWR